MIDIGTWVRVLLVEDDPDDVFLMADTLSHSKTGRFKIENAGCLEEGLERLKEGGLDIVVLDLSLPDSQGLDGLAQVVSLSPEVAIIILTGLDDEDAGLNAVRNGAQDYLVKGEADHHLLERAIRYAIERKNTEKRLRASEANFRNMVNGNPDGFVIVDSEGRMRFLNPSAEAMFGRPGAVLFGEDFEFPLGTAGMTEINIERQDESTVYAELRTVDIEWAGRPAHLASLRDITERKRLEQEREQLSHQLREAGARIEVLSGLLPMCAWCKRIRDDRGYWKQIEYYITSNEGAQLSHGICEDCARKEYPDYYDKLSLEDKGT